jgi:trehalose synthase
MKDVGLDAHWEVIEGEFEFFNVTKKIHNALQGMNIQLTAEEKRMYLEYNKRNSEAALLGTDYVVIHDNQPVAMIQFRPQPELNKSKWIWRCHIDLSTPNLAVWGFLEPYIQRYKAAVFSSEKYVIPSLKVPRILVRPPSINPLNDKNKELSESQILDVLKKYGINPEKPIITQVGRFDPWKDPIGAIDLYRIVKKTIPDIQLLLIAGMARDDPEGWLFFEKTARHAGLDEDIHFLTDLKGVGNLEVNAFQRASKVALQMSIREGFGLSVSEALWKGVPVVGRNVGGIPMQVIDQVDGFLVEDINQAAEKTLYLLTHPEEAELMGQKGREHVRKNFLTVGDLRDYLKLFIGMEEDNLQHSEKEEAAPSHSDPFSETPT